MRRSCSSPWDGRDGKGSTRKSEKLKGWGKGGFFTLQTIHLKRNMVLLRKLLLLMLLLVPTRCHQNHKDHHQLGYMLAAGLLAKMLGDHHGGGHHCQHHPIHIPVFHGHHRK